MLSELIKHYRKIIGKENTHPNSLRKGFYSLNGFDICPVEELAVVVHPFFDIYENPPYLMNFYKFLNSFSYPILTLEEGNKLEETMDKYRKSNITSNRFFIKTEDSNPDPTEITWNDVANFVKEFKPKKLKAAGGYYSIYSDDLKGDIEYGGCLGGAIDILRKAFNNIEVVEGCTF